MVKRPSETARGLDWIAGFKPQEAVAARHLLDSLQVVSETAFRSELSAHLGQCIALATPPVAVLPIREVRKSKGPGTLIHEEAGAAPAALAALSAPYEALPGSEGIVGNIIRSELRAAKAKKWQFDPTLETLRKEKARTLIFVDDYSASGKRADDYVNSWSENPTIRSWHSYRLIQIHVVLFAASNQALNRLAQNRWVTDVHLVQRAPDFSTALWTEGERSRIERLCLDYAFKRDYAFGFQDAGGLLAFQHTVPNDLPCILWQREGPRRTDFSPVFTTRQMSAQQQQELAGYTPPSSAADIARSLDQQRLAEALDQQPGANTRLVLQALMAVARGARDIGKLSATLTLPLAAVEQIVGACRQLGLLDAEARLTDHGRAELAAVRGRVQLPSPAWELRENDRPYYPLELREAGGV